MDAVVDWTRARFSDEGGRRPMVLVPLWGHAYKYLQDDASPPGFVWLKEVAVR